jgi:hypothetical protein
MEKNMNKADLKNTKKGGGPKLRAHDDLGAFRRQDDDIGYDIALQVGANLVKEADKRG